MCDVNVLFAYSLPNQKIDQSYSNGVVFKMPHYKFSKNYDRNVRAYIHPHMPSHTPTFKSFSRKKGTTPSSKKPGQQVYNYYTPKVQPNEPKQANLPRKRHTLT
jgi:hypothetical protein